MRFVFLPLKRTSREDRGPSGHMLTGLRENLSSGRQVDVHPAAEADNTEIFRPGLHVWIGLQIALNPAGDKTGDLHHRQFPDLAAPFAAAVESFRRTDIHARCGRWLCRTKH